ncbi:MAG: MoaD/ThiS family protein [Thermoplasmatales archaeon]
MPLVKILGENKKIRIEGKTAIEILHSLGLNSNSTIVLKDGRPIPDDEELSEGDEITVMKSFSGG